MWSRVYVTVERLSVCLFHRPTAAAKAGGFAAERPAGMRYRPTAAGAGAAHWLQARSAANEDSVTLTAEDEAVHRLVLSYVKGGSLACWTQTQKGPGLNRSRDAVG